MLAAAGWLGSAVGYTVAAVALSKSYRHITGDNWRAAIDEIRWLLPLDDLVVRDGLSRLGGVDDTGGDQRPPRRPAGFVAVAAAARISARSDAAARGCLDLPDRSHNGWWLAGAIVWVCIGHGFVLMSLRSSARRIGADADQFTKLIWFPLASLGYRIIATTVLPETSFNNTTWFAVLVAIDVILMMATAFAVWRAMHSFDHACARDRYSSVENHLPAFMAAAHR